jgi:hypothetical protein
MVFLVVDPPPCPIDFDGQDQVYLLKDAKKERKDKDAAAAIEVILEQTQGDRDLSLNSVFCLES